MRIPWPLLGNTAVFCVVCVVVLLPAARALPPALAVVARLCLRACRWPAFSFVTSLLLVCRPMAAVEDVLRKLAKLPQNTACANCGKEDRVFGYKNIVMAYRTFVCGLCKAAHQGYSHRVKVRHASRCMRRAVLRDCLLAIFALGCPGRLLCTRSVRCAAACAALARRPHPCHHRLAPSTRPAPPPPRRRRSTRATFRRPRWTRSSRPAAPTTPAARRGWPSARPTTPRARARATPSKSTRPLCSWPTRTSAGAWSALGLAAGRP